MLNMRGKNALCVGGTSGIGRAVAIRLAELQANVTVVGRNAEAGNEIVNELSKVNPTGVHSFIAVDASSMKSIKNGCENFLSANKDKPLHYLIMSQGIASINGRTETKEGVDVKLALHYYGRTLFMRQLGDKLKETALQSADSDVRVLNILSGGVHSAYTDATDLDLQRNFSIPNAANAAGFYNDLTMDRFARDDNYLHLTQESTTTTTKNANNSNNNSNTEVGAPQRGISYIHAAPGFVRTTWGKDFPLYLTLPLRLAQHFFAKSPEQCASLMVEHALLGADRRGQGFHVMGELGQAGKVTPQHSEEWRERVWEHGNEVIDRALAMN